MTMTRLDARHVDIELLKEKPVAVLGYGNQGHAHALNLRDSGIDVIVGQRTDGDGFGRALRDGFEPQTVRKSVRSAGLVIVTLPDESAADTYKLEVKPWLQRGQTLGFVHGFNIRYRFIEPPEDVDCILVAPKGPGTLLRSLYLAGKGLPALIAVECDPSGTALATALAWAEGIGATRAGLVQTTFADETETDLFGEQTVLCGGVTALMKTAFQTLVEAGYPAEIAYLECVHELKQVVDLIYEGGLTNMRRRISNTAEYGDLTRGPRLINDETRRAMQQILEDIRGGTFAREWLEEYRRGMPELKRRFEADASSAFEEAGRQVRTLMPWLADS